MGVHTIHNSKRVIAIGNKIILRKESETFHEFIISLLLSSFGEEWLKNQENVKSNEQHIVFKWYNEYLLLKKTNAKFDQEKKVWIAKSTGNVWAFLSFCYDFYVLKCKNLISQSFLKRLKDFHNFQGARYELAIARIFVKENYKLKFVEDSIKHEEFLITKSHTNQTISIETKSRHREGVLNKSGEMKGIEDLSIGVHRLLNQALKKEISNPFIVFIDFNIPFEDTEHPTQKKWWREIFKAIDSFDEISEVNPEKYTMLIGTNFSFHYDGQNEVDIKKYHLDTSSIIPLYSKFP
ncbi:MAG TPA: hypothetical protein VK004_02835, partial [Ignavibacteria bacterium]|nr:hypothetical protein [Ignavibacteria bacterium]